MRLFNFLYHDIYLPTMKALGNQADETVLITDVNSVLDVILPKNIPGNVICTYSAYHNVLDNKLKPEAQEIIRKYAAQHKGRIVIKPELAKAAGLNPTKVSVHYTQDP